MTRDQLRGLQWQKLAFGLDRVFQANPFYREKLRRAGLDRASIQRLEDLERLPLTTKDELLDEQAAHPPYGSILTEPLERYTRLHQTSGTSGRRLRWLDTPESWNWIQACWKFIYHAIGVTARDRLFFAFSFGPFLGFWAAFEGALRHGCFALAGGGLTTRARLELLIENETTIVLCTPSYALRMAQAAVEHGIDLAAGRVRALILAGEPGANVPSIRQQLESAWNARVFDHWGMTEIGSLGIEFADLPGKLFLIESQAVFEFIDPKTGRFASEGEPAELVVSNLGRWACPLLRYRTGDLVRHRRDVHPPGLPFVYCDHGILGRTDDMLLIKGANVYPSAVEGILRGFAQIAEYQIEAVDRGGVTTVEIQIEPILSAAGDPMLATAVVKAVQDRLYFRPTVRMVDPGSLPRYEMKARRFRRRQ
jgi:phenylacetate-CoA ligase